MLKSGPRMGPKTFLNCSVLNSLSCKAKQLKNVLGHVLGLDFNIQIQSLKVQKKSWHGNGCKTLTK